VPQPPAADTPSAKARPKNAAWDCPFPKEADAKGIDDADVVVIVSVAADGQPTGARVGGAAPNGFGPAALRCALAQEYQPAREGGARVAGETPPIKVRFRR
jgi:protein TonB